MWSEIKLDDNCRYSYELRSMHLRRYHFTYTHSNGIPDTTYYDIYLNVNDFEDSFMVSTFGEDDKYFDTYKEAKEYALTEMCNLYIRLIKEEKEITEATSRRGKRGRKKND